MPSFPRMLEITLIAPCPIQCSYCPQDVLTKNYLGDKKMTWDVFKKIMSNTPSDVEISFAGFGEPMVHSKSVDMIKYAQSQGHEVALCTTGVGMSKCDLDQLCKLKKFWYVKYHMLRGEAAKKFDQSILDEGDIPANEFIRSKVGGDDGSWLVSRAGNLEDKIYKEGSIFCRRSPNLTQPVVMPDGNAYLCCCDFGLKAPVGNLLTQTFDELDVTKYLEAQQNGDDVICRHCELSLPRKTNDKTIS
jgi:sulfatase maturation enzyme AslB (radical SAM superfamily)